ncbi:MAG: hypothetical protein ACD_49C00051G0019 [uncultured bacterium (gcode 4)]|uniref:Uncharacterized protein n=1 Tax=uncultured bacterium (gcode 4) TaxID=1234023 RepID=K2AE38_9BACT|nr:MAG: hypothetical protein ACD_49C00051G0019 [uncultured bacterium (gcode 4)]
MAIQAVSTMNQALTQTWGSNQSETPKQTETPKEWVKQADWITGVQTITKKAVAAIWNSEDTARTERNKAEKKWENVSVMA